MKYILEYVGISLIRIDYVLQVFHMLVIGITLYIKLMNISMKSKYIIPLPLKNDFHITYIGTVYIQEGIWKGIVSTYTMENIFSQINLV